MFLSTGCILFSDLISIYILESFGFISGLFREDISYISSLIVSIFIFYLFRGGYYLYILRNAIDNLDRNDLRLNNNIFVDILDEYKVSSSSNPNKNRFKKN